MQTTPILVEIQQLVANFSREKQEALLKELRKQVILADARHLDKGIKPNNISMQEIVEDVRKVRKALYAKK